MPTRDADNPAAASRQAGNCSSPGRLCVCLKLSCSSVISSSARSVAAVSLARQLGTAPAIFESGQAAPAPIVGVDFLDDDEGRLRRLVQDIEQKLADALDQR